MTPKELEKIQAAFTELGEPADFKAVAGAYKITTKFVDRNNQPIVFYTYTHQRPKKIFFTDAGRITQTLQSSGLSVEMKLLQSLLRSYDMIVDEQGSAIEMSDRPLWERVRSMIQAYCAADGVLRTWTRPKG